MSTQLIYRSSRTLITIGLLLASSAIAGGHDPNGSSQNRQDELEKTPLIGAPSEGKEAQYFEFDQFPDELLMHVLSFLDHPSLLAARSVNGQWHSVATEKIATYELILNALKKQEKEKAIGILELSIHQLNPKEIFEILVAYEFAHPYWTTLRVGKSQRSRFGFISQLVPLFQKRKVAQDEQVTFDFNNTKIFTPRIMDTIEKKADLRDPYSLFNLGLVENHKGNFVKASHFFELASKDGVGAASYYLSHAYGRGIGVKQDLLKSRELRLLATQQGESNALIEIAAGEYSNGNQAAALKNLESAAEKDHVFALWSLGRIYQKGMWGMNKSGAKAIEYLKRAAEYEQMDALEELGDIYADGSNGVEANLVKAADYYDRAAKLGSKSAQQKLKRLLKIE